LFTLSGLFVFYEILVEKEKMKEQRETNGKFEAKGAEGDLLSMVYYSVPTSSITEDIDM